MYFSFLNIIWFIRSYINSLQIL